MARSPVQMDLRTIELNAWCGHTHGMECWRGVFYTLEDMERDERPDWKRALEIDPPEYNYRRRRKYE